MRFPQLVDWKTTSWALHQASMLLGPIHNAVFAPRNNYLHLPIFIEPTGLVSQRLPQGGHVHVDFKAAAVVYRPASGGEVRLGLAEHTQASLFQALLGALRQDELAAFLADAPNDDLITHLMTKLRADTSRVEFLSLEAVTNREPLTVNPHTATAYADVLYSVYTAVARFRARLDGHMTPVVVWPEHFDLSTLWFHPDNAAMDAYKAHLNFGFTPYTPGQYDEPYLYAYAYPYPEPFTPPALPEPAFWNMDGWRGVAVRYEALQGHDDPSGFVETLFAQIFAVLQGLLKQG